jgi:hypothetical protein
MQDEITEMRALTLELEDETNSLLQTEARKVNLSPVEFARLAIVRALARVGKDANLERRATKSDGLGWDRVRQAIPDALPQAGDELPR